MTILRKSVIYTCDLEEYLTFKKFESIINRALNGIDGTCAATAFSMKNKNGKSQVLIKWDDDIELNRFNVDLDTWKKFW